MHVIFDGDIPSHFADIEKHCQLGAYLFVTCSGLLSHLGHDECANDEVFSVV